MLNYIRELIIAKRKSLNTLNTHVVAHAPNQGAGKDIVKVKLNDIVELVLEEGLEDTFWTDARIPVNATKTGGAKQPSFEKIFDDGAGSQGVYAYLFADNAEQELFFALQLGHDWKIGSAIHPHVHWTPVANGGVGETVSWGLEYTVSDINKVFSNTTIIYGNTTFPDEDLVASKHILTEIGIIDMSDVNSVSPMLICRVFRDATSTGLTDNYGDDVGLFEIDFHYELDGIGSKEEYSK